jgi:hypothetical protein
MDPAAKPVAAAVASHTAGFGYITRQSKNAFLNSCITYPAAQECDASKAAHCNHARLKNN